MMHPHGIEEPAGQPKPLPSLQAYQDAASKLRTSLGAYDAPLTLVGMFAQLTSLATTLTY